MSADEDATLAGRARLMSDLAAGLTPETARAAAQRGVDLLGDLPGDPEALDDLAVAFRLAADALRVVGQDAAAQADLTAVWQGQTAEAAGERIDDDARQVAADAAVFAEAGEVLGALAGQLRQAAKEHAELRQRLVDLDHQAVEAGQDRLGDLSVQVAGALDAGARLLAQVHTDHDTAAARFRRLAAEPATDPANPTAPQSLLAARPGRLPLDEIYRRYQVSVDPEGLVTYPNGATGWLMSKLNIRRAEVTVGEARMLDRLGPWGVKDAYDIQKVALNRAERVFPQDGITDGHADAFRHAYWNALLTRRFGVEWAEQYCTAHERNPKNTGGSEAMDLHNNEVGRRIALAHPDADPDELAALVEKAVRAGDTVVIDRAGHLAYSDQLDPGDTGHADDTQPQGRAPGTSAPYGGSGGYNPGSDADIYGTAGNY
ncbi:hypothetical protein LX15_000313 [Streptoalloteichus tenebrarius]|uniref:DUF6973 domain-containing protein n=1 Tax=Streptoalloteichus tenebrarius (strain ATCC 17920 / DSM 40477 / JCM 4838 / CBS 697.72 / NBRC 16177 / NCIMB 11028 / NRRL B-12390 / A12253. 1 / ISP 5477) TaxID=1933 RepID=A0ABT1HMB0_STRSD|nr:hypothetical protein [Streptoalloteichus tenebrarius]MCP2256630.1 hypothetical protein [Streptoalloteichus tenebrarius]BFF04983.1 hypothetical protein GCM10020241_66580 [Streptoalloteichus tenebrarius]